MMAKKNKMQLADDAIPEVDPDRRLTGADLESIVIGAGGWHWQTGATW